MPYEAEKEGIRKLSEAIGKIEDRARKENRAMNAKEAGLVAEMEIEIDKLRNELPANAPLSLEGPGRYDSTGTPIDYRTTSTIETSAARGRDYRSMFKIGRNDRLDNGDFKSAAEFIAVMDSGRYDPRLQARASMGEGIPSSGGFSVPAQFASEWLDASLPTEIVRNLCKVYPMESQSLEVPGWDGADMSAGKTHGGLEMTFMAEGSDATTQTAKLRKIMLSAKTGGIYVDASVELIQDGKGFAENLQTALTKSVGYGIDRYCIAGVGGNSPLGILNSPCKIQVAGEGGQRADTLIYSNLKKCFARALNPDKSVWLFNPTCIPDLLEQSVAVGVAGSFVPLLNESNGKFTIFGRPVYFSPVMPVIGDADDCAFVDFSYFALGLRKEISLDISDAPRWLQRERSFRVLLRFDGQCTLDKAVTPEHGLTLSPVVTMAAR